MPACEKVAEAGLRCRADLLAAATCVAAERFRLKHNRLPRELAELVPAFLPAVPLNPFDGKPIAFRTFADRIAVYGYWEKTPYKVDDLPEDFREGARPGGGIGYRVWLPAHRGLEAAREAREEKKAP